MGIIGEGLEILGLIDKAKNADVYRQLGDYIDKVRAQQIENDKLNDEIRELKEKLKFKGSFERLNGHVFMQGDDEEVCQRCAEVDYRPVHLIIRYGSWREESACPQCKTEYRQARVKRDGAFDE